MTTPRDEIYFEQVLEYLQQTRGFDFTAYKRASLVRRVQKRMQDVGAAGFEEYLDYLQVHNTEFAALFDTILINVTSFFRDTEVWDYVASDVLPRVIDRNSVEPIRVWSAGCATGQEAYTLAMLLAEHLGTENWRERVKIYATDVDEGALAEARQATYSARQMGDVPPALLEKYFDQVGSQYSFNRELRRAVIFGRHDLIQDAPISRVDLLVCRNTLMYFNAEAQAKILARFFFSLRPSGFIVLGRAEMLFSHGAMFTPVDLKRRVFRLVPKPNHRDRLLLLAQTGRDVMPTPTPNLARLKDAAFETDQAPQLLVDTGGALTGINAAARQRFHVTERDLGRQLQDLEIAYRPAELRKLIERAGDERHEVAAREVKWSIGSEVRHLEVAVTPLFDEEHLLLGTRVLYRDVSDQKALQVQLQHSKQELETAHEELQSTNEELETTNEELQSTVEELETTNEELQSTNEELETMNEELQSTNEELQTINDELRNRSADLNSANAFLASVFGSLRSAVVVLDREYRVLVWNERASDLWGMRAEEAQDNHFLGLDIGLPLAELRVPILDVLGGAATDKETTVPATSRRGKAIECRVHISPLKDQDRGVAGVILLMEERPGGQPS